MILFVRIWAPISGVLNKRQIYSLLGLTSAATLYVRRSLAPHNIWQDCREADSRDTSPRHACLGEVSRKIWLHDFAINNNGGSVPVIFISLVVRGITRKSLAQLVLLNTSQTQSGYSFMLQSPNQTANQIRRSYKNDQSNIFVTVYFVTWKYNPVLVRTRVYVWQFSVHICAKIPQVYL